MKQRHVVISMLFYWVYGGVTVGIGLGFFWSWMLANNSYPSMLYSGLVCMFGGLVIVLMKIRSPNGRKAIAQLEHWIEKDSPDSNQPRIHL